MLSKQEMSEQLTELHSLLAKAASETRFPTVNVSACSNFVDLHKTYVGNLLICLCSGGNRINEEVFVVAFRHVIAIIQRHDGSISLLSDFMDDLGADEDIYKAFIDFFTNLNMTMFIGAMSNACQDISSDDIGFSDFVYWANDLLVTMTIFLLTHDIDVKELFKRI